MLEIACFDMTSAEIALKSVADRIELCSEISEGGLTPNFEEFRYLKSTYDTPIFVMVRPKGGSFIYSDAEFLQMQRDIERFRDAGADGFVFGTLTYGNTIDQEKNTLLIDLAAGVPCTFHRAVDRTPNLEQAVAQLIDIGFRGVLTSGGKKSAMHGKENLKSLVAKFDGRIDILVGGGVRSENISQLKNETGASNFHSSAIRPFESYASDEEIKKLKLISG